jgi:multidrug resistance efflux pump
MDLIIGSDRFWYLLFLFSYRSSGAGDGRGYCQQPCADYTSGRWGVLSTLNVKEGDRVAKGEILATLDQTRIGASVKEVDVRLSA